MRLPSVGLLAKSLYSSLFTKMVGNNDDTKKQQKVKEK